MLTTHVSVIVPVFNNAETVGPLAERLIRVLRNFTERSSELIFVDDGSCDASWQHICDLAERYSEVIGIRLSRNFGQHAALLAGLARASGDVTCMMDADLEHRPEDLPELVEQVENGFDLVVATDSGNLRRKSSAVFRRLLGLVSRNTTHPKELTYRAMSKAFREAVSQYGEVDAVLGPLMSSIGFRQGYVSVTRDTPADGRSRYSAFKRIRLAVDALLLHSTVLSVVFAFLAGLTAVVTAAYGVTVAVQTLVIGVRLPDGLTLLLLAVLGSSALQLAGLAVVSYVAVAVLRQTKQRPRFHIADTVVGKLPP